MKTEKQNEVMQVINDYLEAEKKEIDRLCLLLVKIIQDGYAKLIRDRYQYHLSSISS